MTKRNKPATTLAKASQPARHKAPLSEHLQELKRRLIYVVVSIAVGSGLAYGVESHLISVLLRPSHGQHFVYTSPMGGVNFLFSVCIFVGIALSLPVIVYNLLQFILPLMRYTTTKFIYACSVASGVVAVCGILFGYYAGLPAALHFLLHQFHSTQVTALISIQSYFSFVTAYMVGAAIMFQLPLILIIINRIKPLKPSQMFKSERAVILFAFIAAFIMNPTPNVIDQMLVVIPIVIMYQLGIGLVWFINQRNGRIKYQTLFEQDVNVQAERLKQASIAQPLIDPKLVAITPGPIDTIVLEDEPTSVAKIVAPTETVETAQVEAQTVPSRSIFVQETPTLTPQGAFTSTRQSIPIQTMYQTASTRLVQ